MNKLTKIIVAVLICLFPFVLFVGCGEAKISSMSLKVGTLETTIAKGDTLDTSNTILNVKYSDGKTIEVGADKLSFTNVDTSTVGNKTLTITYEDENGKSKSINVTIKVVATEADVASISSLTSQILTEYNANKAVQDTANKQIEFMDNNQPLYVGDDNPFHFRLLAGGYDGTGAFVANITEVRTNMTISLLGDDPRTTEVEPDNTVTPLSGTSLTYFVAIDSEKSTLDFTEQAVGSKFRVTVEAANKDVTAQENAVKFAADLEVIDAYNVYTAEDLIVYDNSNDGYYDTQRAALGLTYEDIQAINGIVLQADITIEKDDVRQDIFWTKDTTNYNTAKTYTNQTLEGTPIDISGTGLYYREIAKGDTFNFIGNYFTIDLSKFPLMVVEGRGTDEKKAVWSEQNEKGEYVGAKYMTSHLSVFYTKTSTTATANTHVNWKNINFVGNSTLNNDPRYSGGILLMKNREVNFEAYNTITNNFYIGYFLEFGEPENDNTGDFLVNQCKGYNYYQCIFYVFGAKHLVIKDCEFIRAGGPAIITDHCDMENDDPNTGYPSHVDVINSNIESVVTAQSPWFTTYGADGIMKEIPTLEVLFDGSTGKLPQTDKTIIAGSETIDGEDYQELNIIAIIKSDGSDIDLTGGTLFDVRGYVRLFDTEDDYNRYYGYGKYEGNADTSFYYGLDMDGVLNQKARGVAHFIEDSGTGAYINSAVANGNIDLTLFKGEDKANGMMQVINGVLDGAASQYPGMATMINSLKINETEFMSKDLNGKKSMLQTVLNNIASLPSPYSDGLIEQIYNFAQTNDITVGFGDSWSQGDVDAKVALLNAEIARYAVLPQGDTINLYTSLGIGAIIGTYPRQAA